MYRNLYHSLFKSIRETQHRFLHRIISVGGSCDSSLQQSTLPGRHLQCLLSRRPLVRVFCARLFLTGRCAKRKLEGGALVFSAGPPVCVGRELRALRAFLSVCARAEEASQAFWNPPPPPSPRISVSFPSVKRRKLNLGTTFSRDHLGPKRNPRLSYRLVRIFSKLSNRATECTHCCCTHDPLRAPPTPTPLASRGPSTLILLNFKGLQIRCSSTDGVPH